MHKINNISELETTPSKYGVEIDVRGFGDELLLSHDTISPTKKYDTLSEYLKKYRHSFLILNIKESGYEDRVIKLLNESNIDNYFLLDVEFPFLYKASRNGFKKIAVRYSEAEPIEYTLAQKPLLEWVWIDTITKLPLDKKVMEQLHGFKKCIVSPERWGRPYDIKKYALFLSEQNIEIDVVMTSPEFVWIWEDIYG